MPTKEDLQQFLFTFEPDIVVDPDCEGEVYKIVAESGKIRKFKSDYEARMKLLRIYREQAYNVHSQWFEKLKRVPDAPLYSMHLATIDNMRILYIVGDRIILLCAFKEKGTRGQKTQSYRQYIPVAINRMKRYVEGKK